MIERPFQPRAQRVFDSVYAGSNPPPVRFHSESAAWLISHGEIWQTNPEFDRLTRLVLACHHQRIGATIRHREEGIQVSLVHLDHAPGNPTLHHPGLSDLVATAYSIAGRPTELDSLSARLSRARTAISDLLREFPIPIDHPATQAALSALEEVS